MQLLVGTSGFSYPAWRGSFYPEKLAPDAMLRFYSGQLGAVEINNTFYRMPNKAVLAGWSEQTPEPFYFAIKAPRQITHIRRLKDASGAVEALFAAMEALGTKRGPVLFQLPPFFRKDVGLLSEFLAQLPKCDATFEFRHASWLDDEVYRTLADRNAALCIAEDDRGSTPPVATADWGYLRLRRVDYEKADLAHWAERVSAEPWSRAFVFFKHEDEGRGPKLARAFLDGIASGG